ncbi:putative F-box/LRR-repeat protein isoform X2, partial [Tanacetum coccineum]
MNNLFKRSDTNPNRYVTPSSHSGSTSEPLDENEGGHSQGLDAAASEDGRSANHEDNVNITSEGSGPLFSSQNDQNIVIVRCLVSLALQNGWTLCQMDVNNAFLYGDLNETVYMTLPPGYFPKDETRVLTVAGTEDGAATAYTFSCLSQFMHRPLKSHLKTALKVISLPIQSFDLQFDIWNQKSASLANKWIMSVASKSALKEIFLSIWVGNDSFTLPDEIFSSANLHEIKISAMTNPLCIPHNRVILCVSLRVLELNYLYISEDALHNLLSTCSLLEKINLCCCEGFKTIKLKNLRCLRELEISSIEQNDILEIDDVPSLGIFHYNSMLQLEEASIQHGFIRQRDTSGYKWCGPGQCLFRHDQIQFSISREFESCNHISGAGKHSYHKFTAKEVDLTVVVV